jgi:hypothetical protein
MIDLVFVKYKIILTRTKFNHQHCNSIFISSALPKKIFAGLDCWSIFMHLCFGHGLVFSIQAPIFVLITFMDESDK